MHQLPRWGTAGRHSPRLPLQAAAGEEGHPTMSVSNTLHLDRALTHGVRFKSGRRSDQICDS
jgi:hypothetical protein